jgi:transcriptional regulator of arginine metabolism
MRGRPSTDAGSATTRAARGPVASFAAETAREGGTRASAVATAVGSLPSSAAAARSKADRQRAIADLVADGDIASQGELVDRLTERGFIVTQATVSRDIAELGLLKIPRNGRTVYVSPESLGTAAGASAAAPGGASDLRLHRILTDIPVTVGRSGLILLVTGSPGTASIIAQAIDESSLSEQEGTLAGDNTLLVLFSDEARLLRWQARFDAIRSSEVGPPASSSATSA